MYENQIEGLEFEELFDMLLAYADALFEIGDHEKHLVATDKVLEASVMNNIKFFNGEDVFHKALFKKAASNFALYRYEECDYILREMLRIDPYDTDGALFLKKCLRDMHSGAIKKTRAIAVLLLIISALLICFELLVVHAFYPGFSGAFALLRAATLVLTVLILIGGELFHRLRCGREVDNFVEHLKRRKK